MGYTKRIVCLAASLKNGGLCIAGREVGEGGFGGWVRPISSRDGSELTFLEYRYEDFSSPQLLDVIEVPLLGPSAHGHQTENHLIDQTRRWVKRGRAAFRRLKDLVEEPAALWLNAGSTASGHYNCLAPAGAAEFDWPLCLIRRRRQRRRFGSGLRLTRGWMQGGKADPYGMTNKRAARRRARWPSSTRASRTG